MRNRGFEKVKKFENIDFNLPKRSTKHSAGYDFESPEDAELLPREVKIVTTGVKAYMKEDEVLELYNRSSNGRKGLIIPNSVGIIDGDYYNNPENEGEIAFLFQNTTDEVFKIKKGERIGQGIFKKFLTIDNEEEITEERTGGFGSTDKKGITLVALAITLIVLIILISTTVYLTIYNLEQSRKNTYLAEIQMVQNVVLEVINVAKVEEKGINPILKAKPLTTLEVNEFQDYLLSSSGDFYFLTKDELDFMNLKNVNDSQQFIVNWDTGEVLNLNRSEYKGTIIRGAPVLEE